MPSGRIQSPGPGKRRARERLREGVVADGNGRAGSGDDAPQVGKKGIARQRERNAQVMRRGAADIQTAFCFFDIPAIRQALDQALSFTGDIDTALVATILDRVVVKKESTKDDIHLDIFLKLGSTYEAVYTPLKHTAGNTSLKNTTHKPPTRRI